QAAFGDNRCGQPKGGLDKHRRKEIGQQVSRNNASGLAAERPGRLNKLALPERKNLASDQSCVAGPADQTKRQNDVIKTRTEYGREGDGEKNPGKTNKYTTKTHKKSTNPSAKISRQ